MGEHLFVNEMEYHKKLLCLARKSRLLRPAAPKAWDYLSLQLGQWLIDRGQRLVARSKNTQPLGRQA